MLGGEVCRFKGPWKINPAPTGRAAGLPPLAPLERGEARGQRPGWGKHRKRAGAPRAVPRPRPHLCGGSGQKAGAPAGRREGSVQAGVSACALNGAVRPCGRLHPDGAVGRASLGRVVSGRMLSPPAGALCREERSARLRSAGQEARRLQSAERLGEGSGA